MWKQIIAFLKAGAATYKRIAQADENIKKLQGRVDGHDDELEDARDTLIKVLHEFDKDRSVAIERQRATERDYENLVLRLENALLKNAEQRALPPGSAAPQNEMAELRAKVEAQGKAIERLVQRVETLESAA